jgi:hypothetical protein
MKIKSFYEKLQFGYVDIRKVFFCFPLIYFAVMFVSFVVDKRIFWRLIKEDGVFEYLQAVSYLSAAFFAMALTVRFRSIGHNKVCLFYLLLTVGLLFVSFEEISWGQRILGIKTPELLKLHNTQRELTLHNIEFVQNNILHQAYIIVGLCAGLSWLVIPDSLLTRWDGLLSYLIPGWTTTLYFVPVGLYYAYWEIGNLLLSPNFGPPKSQELFETPFAAGFFVFVLFTFFRLERIQSSAIIRLTKSKSKYNA